MRISRHMMFMKMAEAASCRSTCYRRSVGSIIVRNNNVIGIGYNGPAPGQPHCTGHTCPSNSICTRAVHAEENSLRRAYAHTMSGIGDTMYVTESPCPTCASLAIANGIKEVFYLHEYRVKEGIDILVTAGIKVFRMTPGGYIIDYATNQLVEDLA